MTIPIFDSESFNDWADYWYYEIGMNVIPANTRKKETYESWLQWQENPIPVELHEQRKKNGEYNNGIAIVTSRIWRGLNEGKYLIGIDCDNKKAIEEICIRNGKTITLEELAQWTIVEQHKDNVDKAHIYILSTKAFKNKSRNINNNSNSELSTQIPAIEVKCEKRIMFVSPSMHENGAYPYEILGTKKPVICDEFEVHLDNIFRKYGIEYIEKNKENNNNYNTSKLPNQLRQLINILDIPQDFQYRIPEGVRHDMLLAFADSNYDSINIMLPSMFLKYQSNTYLLNYQARLRRKSVKNNTNSESSTRIMIMEKYSIEKDWENHNTRDACIEFLNWHKDWGVTLLQIEPSYANELKRNIEESTNFQFKSMDIGLWKDKYLVQFGEYQLDDKKDDVRKYNMWISDSNTISYVNCELFINTILDHNEIYEIKYDDDKRNPEFIKWNHSYWKTKL